MNVRVHLYISGRVQGVFFRDSAQQIAQFLEVTGYVRNLKDGRVEVVAEGAKEAVDKLLQWCHKGPPEAMVEAVEVHNEFYKGEFGIFEVRR